ncbi:16S rRNA (cytosine(967)-C(5))-methyltransferase RsmB [Lacimicrobium alkaliphilum]|uniref:16S rRNA (cytosine(967)-C(5))-methyltransferase n=1 Tax=Lacimicrobium alkaliphilum TaxID=1526571 RepID=A0ABQ1RIW7_9ALTE|nr:16S rRNA (cytosine(967)-C(5))-methyltransferase RsmB [Lacimicrobium alkaliphilum]GGD72027.1 ribosomal RNA small subunit methyltransferase B [Lacimicrobium alkaliphilum]
MSASKLRADGAIALFNVLEQGQSLRQSFTQLQAQHTERDRAWLQEMVYGVLRNLPQLQCWLRLLLQKPLKKKQKIAEHLLLLGIYQLAFTRVSAHAAVSETVGACDKLKCNGLKGLVNACLRNFIRQDMASRRSEDIQIASGMPKWLYRHLSQIYPQNLEKILAATNERPPIWLRVNQQQISTDEFCEALTEQQIQFESNIADAPYAVILRKGYDLTTLPGYQQGWFSAQDGAAQMAAGLLCAEPSDRVLDACAAPGGKTCHILEMQPQLGECIALDLDSQRLQKVAENLQRLKLKATLLQGDAAQPESWWDGREFDRILLDAPCSATGVIRRHPDIRWLRKDSDIPQLVKTQRQILEALWPLLRTGGTFLYATCSILEQENRLQIQNFLSNLEDAKLLPVTADEGTEQPGMQILPGDREMDGFYYARLIKC